MKQSKTILKKKPLLTQLETLKELKLIFFLQRKLQNRQIAKSSKRNKILYFSNSFFTTYFNVIMFILSIYILFKQCYNFFLNLSYCKVSIHDHHIVT